MSNLASRIPRAFSLRALFAALTLLCAVLAGLQRYAPQWRLARDVALRGGSVEHHEPLGGLPLHLGWPLRDVRAIHLGHRSADEALLEAASRLPRLETLDLARCALDDGALRRVGRCTGLRKLSLWGASLHDGRVESLVGLQALETLDVHATNVTEASLETWRRLPRLRRLKFDFPVSDRGAALLADMSVALPEHWSLRRVSDAGLRDLERLDWTRTRLDRLELDGVTDAGLRRFVAHVPKRVFRGSQWVVHGKTVTSAALDAIPWDCVVATWFAETRVEDRELMRRVRDAMRGVEVGGRHVMLRADEHRRKYAGADESQHGLTPVGDWLEAGVDELSQVRTLELYRAEHLSVRGRLRRWKSLRTVRTYGELPEGLFEELAELPELEHLDVAWNGGVVKRSLEPLRRCPRLRFIRFTATPFTADEIRELGRFASLEEVELHACSFERSVFESFDNFARLRVRWSPAAGPTRDVVEEFSGRR